MNGQLLGSRTGSSLPSFNLSLIKEILTFSFLSVEPAAGLREFGGLFFPLRWDFNSRLLQTAVIPSAAERFSCSQAQTECQQPENSDWTHEEEPAEAVVRPSPGS